MPPTSPALRWADLHNHNEIGYGVGSLDRSYRIARSSLDVYALTVHGHWPDPPASDPKMAEFHLEAFGRVRAAFPEVRRQANQRYEPGKFVPFVAYEWHSTRYGDYVVIFPGDAGELHPANDLAELKEFVRRQQALMIPHHVGYQPGLRGLDWKQADFSASPLVEIFSEHGSTWERDSIWPMLAHSMGGIASSQSIMEQLAAGHHFGFTSGTDTHFGYPGSYGEGITGIYAEALTRESVFDALRRRHTLAATGDRIELWVNSRGALPGDRLPATAPRELAIAVEPLGPLDYVEVIKNGVRSQLWPGLSRRAGVSAAPDTYLVRVEWGWGRMAAEETVDWTIQLQAEGGEFLRVIPCFGAGAGSSEKINWVRSSTSTAIEIESFTSRKNPQPINGVVLEVRGTGATRLTAEVEALSEGQKGGCRPGATLAELYADDVFAAVSPRFSAPQIRLGRAWRKSELAFAATYRDPSPSTRDTYVVKARQANGHTAWASPLLFAD